MPADPSAKGASNFDLRAFDPLSRKTNTLDLLLISAQSLVTQSVGEALADTRHGDFSVVVAADLRAGLERLKSEAFAAIILDLSLPDVHGASGFGRVLRAAPHAPILVFGSPEDEREAIDAIKNGAADYLPQDRLDGFILPHSLRRIIAHRAAEEASFVEQQRAEITLNSIGDAVISTDVAGKVTYINPVAERMTGWSKGDASGRPLEEVCLIIDAATRRPAPNAMAQAQRVDHAVGLTPECLLVRRDGFETAIEDSAAPIHDRAGNVTGAVMVFHDVSAARALSLRATYMAQHDFLTDLPNRMLLLDRLSHAIAFARRDGHRLAVLFLDLDHFKQVNDSVGHVIGDLLLQSTAERLLSCVRQSDTVSRLGGDEFVVLLSHIGDVADAADTAQKIISALAIPHDVGHEQRHVTATVGISMFPEDGQDAEALIKGADTAMYHAKEAGRNSYQFFEPRMQARAAERQAIAAGLHRALAAGQFVLHYQPKINLKSGAITGAEALIRWMHPDRGVTLPREFIFIAEDCGLIVPIGRWVIREACRQSRAWIDAGLQPVPVAVNISAVELRDPGFLSLVREVLAESRLDGCFLEIELTERSLIRHTASTTLTLESLRSMGVMVALDDFGTGYSSLSYLRQFPINVLKIDQMFIHEIGANSVGAPIVSAVISMGRSFGHRVIAEGIETAHQLEFLRSQNCCEGQGYYFSKPLAAEQFITLLDSR